MVSQHSTLQYPIIHSTHLMVHATNERSLSTRGTFRTSLTSESHWLQLVLVLFVHWWSTPISVGGLWVVSSQNTIKNRCCDLEKTWKDTLVIVITRHSSYQSQRQSCIQCGLDIESVWVIMSDSSRLACKWLQRYIKTCGKVVPVQEGWGNGKHIGGIFADPQHCLGETFGHTQWRSQRFQDQPVPWCHGDIFRFFFINTLSTPVGVGH